MGGFRREACEGVSPGNIESRSAGSDPGGTSEGRFCSRDGGGVGAAVWKCRLDERTMQEQKGGGGDPIINKNTM